MAQKALINADNAPSLATRTPMITAGMDVPNAEVASNTINAGACWMKARNCALCTYTRRTSTVIAIGIGNEVTPAVEAAVEAGAEAVAVVMMDADLIFETTEGETTTTVVVVIHQTREVVITLNRRAPHTTQEGRVHHHDRDQDRDIGDAMLAAGRTHRGKGLLFQHNI